MYDVTRNCYIEISEWFNALHWLNIVLSVTEMLSEVNITGLFLLLMLKIIYVTQIIFF